MASKDSYREATKRGKTQRKRTPPAVAARYDRGRDRVVVTLGSGVDVSFSPSSAEGLENATASQLQPIEITPSGLGIYFPKLDADLYLPALLEGVLGSRKWMAAKLGANGGKSTSRAKKRAARANGHLGGRPRKAASG